MMSNGIWRTVLQQLDFNVVGVIDGPKNCRPAR